MKCGFIKDETRRSKFAAQIGQCASMKEVVGTLAVEEINGSYTLSVVSGVFKRNHALHEFIPQRLLNKKVCARWDGRSLLIEETK